MAVLVARRGLGEWLRAATKHIVLMRCAVRTRPALLGATIVAGSHHVALRGAALVHDIAGTARSRPDLLCRHAESEPDKEGARDHDRNISQAGIEASRTVARHLRDAAWLPDLLLCSNSKRTRQTVDAMTEEVPAIGDAGCALPGHIVHDRRA